MLLIEALELASKNAGIRTLSFANLQEFQAFQNSFSFEEYPVNVVIPFTINGQITLNTGLNNDVLPLQGWILTRIKGSPTDYRSRQIEIDYMEPMRRLAKKFFRELSQLDIIDPEVQTISYTVRPEYMFLNNLAFGISYTANIPLSKTVC